MTQNSESPDLPGGFRLLSAGSGAESYKTPRNAPGLVVLPAATSGGGGNQTVTINANLVHDDGHISKVTAQVTLDMFGRVTDAIPLQQAA